MTTVRVYGKIGSMKDLVQLQEVASSHGLIAVGITEGAAMYKLDQMTSMSVSLDVNQAMEILKFDDSQMRQFMEKRGIVEFADNVIEDDPVQPEIEPVEEEPVIEDQVDAEEATPEEPVVIQECPECEDCSIYKDKLSRVKAAIIESVGETTNFIDILDKLLKELE